MILEINKKVLLQEDGIWDAQKRADIQKDINVNKVLSDTYDNNRGQYFLNPFIGGPISHGLNKANMAFDNGMYKALKDDDSAPAPTTADVVADTTKGPWNAQMDVGQKSMENLANTYDKEKAKDPLQAVVNPFVGGGMSSVFKNMQAAQMKNGRMLYSPASTPGDTLIKS